MTVGILDTTVLIHLFRRNLTAGRWLASQSDIKLSVTPIVWMEVMIGATNKRTQADLIALLGGFEMVYLLPTDMDWAMRQMLNYHFSDGVGIMDCFNASVCHRLKIPIYTHNIKDYQKTLPVELVIKPY